MEAENLPSKIQGNFLMQKYHSTMKPEICTQVVSLPDEINPYHIHVFSKHMKNILQDFRRPAHSAIQNTFYRS